MNIHNFQNDKSSVKILAMPFLWLRDTHLLDNFLWADGKYQSFG